MFGLIGHLGLCCFAFNQIHATAWPRSSRKISEKIILLSALVPIAVVLAINLPWAWFGDNPWIAASVGSCQQFVFGWPGIFYARLCLPLGIFFASRWAYRRVTRRLPTSIVHHRQQTYDLKLEINQPLLHGWFARCLGAVPFNQLLLLTTKELTISLEIEAEFDGLRICQLSDLHFTGQIDRAYFEWIVARANAFEPDLIVITGDLVDEPECLPWLDSTLGRLRSRLGCFYILGNHDLRIKDEASYREQLQKIGLVRVAGSWHTVVHNGSEIFITGNELPWFPGAEKLPLRLSGTKAGLKILLSHSPDQIEWARPHGFDLIFAGHTHGGQVALPIIGPIVAPSRYGVLYAAGTFQINDSVMHVSRGISGDEPVRFFSPPELGLFTIRSTRVG